MKVLIAGPRGYTNWNEASEYITMILKNSDVTEIISGACSIGATKYSKPTFTRPNGVKVYGADGLGEKWAAERGIKVTEYPADWVALGYSAGPIRNGIMVNYLDPTVDRAIVFYTSFSKGSKDVIKKLKARGIILREKLVTK